jgi:translation elongation factor EF-1alpha
MLKHNEIYVFDDVLPEKLVNTIESMVKSENMPWYYGNTTMALDDGDGSFSHVIKEGPLATLCYLATDIIADNINMKDINVGRIRAGLITSGEARSHTPHVDFTRPHCTALIYVSDSNAPLTVYEDMFELKHSESKSSYEYYQEIKGNMNVIKTIHVKKGRVVVFNGLQYHNTCVPTDGKPRYAITINFDGVRNA